MHCTVERLHLYACLPACPYSAVSYTTWAQVRAKTATMRCGFKYRCSCRAGADAASQLTMLLVSQTDTAQLQCDPHLLAPSAPFGFEPMLLYVIMLTVPLPLTVVLHRLCCLRANLALCSDSDTCTRCMSA